MAELKSQGPMVPVTKLGPIGANFPRLLDAVRQQINPLEGIAAEARKDLSEQRQLEAADAAAKHEFERDALTGLPVLPEQKSNFSIFGKQFNKEIRRNYLLDVESSVQTKLNALANQYYLNPEEYSAEASAYLDTVVDNVNPIASNYIRHQGGQRLASQLANIRNRYSQKVIAEGRHQQAEESAQILTDTQDMLPGEQATQEIGKAVQKLHESTPNFFVTPGSRKRFERELIRGHWANHVTTKFEDMTREQRLDLLENFKRNRGSFDKYGLTIEPHKEMTVKELDGVMAVLRATAAQLNAVENEGSRQSLMESQRIVAQHLVADLTGNLPEGISPDFTAGLGVLAKRNPSAVIQIATRLRAIAEDENTDKVQRQFAEQAAVQLNTVLKKMNMPAFTFTPRQRQDPSLMLQAVTRGMQLANFERGEQNDAARKSSLKATDVFLENQAQMLQAQLAQHGLSYDISKELNELTGHLTPPPHDPDGIYYRASLGLKSRALNQVYAEARNRIKEKLDSDQSTVDRAALIDTLRLLNGYDKHAKAVTEYMKKIQEEHPDASPAVLGRILTAAMSQSLTQIENDRKNAEIAAPVIANLSRNVPLLFKPTPDQRKFVDQMLGVQIEALGDQGQTEAQRWTGGVVTSMYAQTGVVGQNTIAHMETMASDPATILDASNAYNNFMSLSPALAARFSGLLSKNTRMRLNYLRDNGHSDYNLKKIFDPGFDGKPEETRSAIYGKDVTTQAGNKLFGKLFEEVLESQDNAYEGTFGGRVLEWMAKGILGEAGADWFGINLTEGVQLDKLPTEFVKDVERRLLNEGHIYIKTAGDEEDIKGAIAKITQQVALEGKYAPTRFAPRAQAAGDRGRVIVQNPIEFHARDSEGNVDWLLKWLPEEVNKSVLRGVSNGIEGVPDTEIIEADDIGLRPTDKKNAQNQPLYEVVLIKDGVMVSAFEEYHTAGGDPLDVGIRQITIDVGPALANRNRQLQKIKAFDYRQQVIARQLATTQRDAAHGRNDNLSLSVGLSSSYQDLSDYVAQNNKNQDIGWNDWMMGRRPPVENAFDALLHGSFYGKGADPVFVTTAAQQEWKWRTRPADQQYPHPRLGEGQTLEKQDGQYRPVME